MKKNREQRRQKREAKINFVDEETENAETSEAATTDKLKKTRRTRSKQASIFDEHGNTLSKAEIARQRRAERSRRDQEMALVVKDLFERIDTLDEQIGPSVRGVERPLMREYIKTAQELWDDISSIPAFFPRKIVSVKVY
jgi:5'-3' exonuclease